VKDDERDDVADKAEYTDEAVDTVHDELVQQTARRLLGYDVITDVTVQWKCDVIVVGHVDSSACDVTVYTSHHTAIVK